jgi:UDP-3-O-[3-hydroxymyristoyl] glucosamine N-acyltransferase LpxD
MKKIVSNLISVEEIVAYTTKLDRKAKFWGEEKTVVEKFSSLNSISNKSIIWFRGKQNVDENVIRQLKGVNNILIICNEETKEVLFSALDKNFGINYILTETPRDMYFSILSRFFYSTQNPMIDWERSVIQTSNIGKNVNIGANCFIGPDVEVGNNVFIHNNVVIECPCIIGNYSNIYSGTVIGTKGFGYYVENGKNYQIPHFKGVKIGHHVDIGANTCIDRGCLTDTVIGNYVKIDNLVHIAHNVQISDGSMIVAQAMIAGSSSIGENTYIAPGARVIDQVRIGNNSLIGMGAVVTKSFEDNKVAVGVPAREIRSRDNNER